MVSTASSPKTVTYFNKIVEEEHVKFRRSCEIWKKILEDGSAPVDVHGDILCAIGQANLFQNKRLKQFKDLIDQYRDENAEKKTTESDLEGFWDMILYQVKDVHKRFDSLENMKSRNWVKVEKPANLQTSISGKMAKPKAKSSSFDNERSKNVPSNFTLFKQQMMRNKLENQRRLNVDHNQ